MAKRKPDSTARPLLERLRHPSPRARIYTFLAIWLGSSVYFTGSTVLHDRDLLPKSHDEHSYAIQTQMIARGKLWMPQHELADFFESFQILVRPVYASIYFPGSALMYAPGVWLALPTWVMPVIVSGLGVALTYLLAARLLDGLWALLAALLVVACHWVRMNATLVMSQSPMMALGLGMLLAWLKWRDTKHWRWAAVLGGCAGWGAIVRPVDALAFALPIGIAMLLDLRREPRRSIALTCVAVVLAAIPFLSLQLVMNKGITGSFTRAAHTLYLETDQPDTTYGFHAYDPQAAPRSNLAQKIVYYRNFMLPDIARHQLDQLPRLAWDRLRLTLEVAFPIKALALLALVGILALHDGPRRVVAAVPVVFFLLYLPYTFYMEHYVIPVIAPVTMLVLFGAERIASAWNAPAARVRATRLIAAALIVIGLASLPELNPRVRDDLMFAPTSTFVRTLLRPRVQAPAVVLVRYDPAQNPHDEPVYNSTVAWPDDAPIVLAHDLGPRNAEIVRYFAARDPGRHFYLFDRTNLFERPDFPLRALGTAAELAARLSSRAGAPATTGQVDPE